MAEPRLTDLRTPTSADFGDDWSEIGDKLVSVRVEGEPWTLVVADLCAQHDVPVILPDPEEVTQSVTLHLVDVPLRLALAKLAASAETSVRMDGGLVWFGQSGVESVGTVPIGYVDPQHAHEIVSSVLAEGASVSQLGSRLVVSGDRESVERAVRVGSLMEASEPAQWTVSVYLAEVSRELQQRVGVELAAQGVATGVISGEIASAMSQLILDLAATARIEASSSTNHARVLTGSTLVVLEGTPASIEAVEHIPFLTESITQEGNVATREFGEVQAGIVVQVEARRVPGGGVLVKLEPSVTTVSGFVDTHPILDERSFSATAIVESGAWLVLGGLDSWRSIRGERGLLAPGVSRDDAVTSLLLMARVEAIAPRGTIIGTPDGV